MPKRKRKIQLLWIESTGGPLLVIPSAYASKWQGSNEPNGRRKVVAKSRFMGDGPATDYDLACDVEDYLGVVAAGKGHALVLGGEPAPSAWVEVEDRLFVLRWIAGGSENDVVAAMLMTLSTPQPSICDVAFTHPGGELILMDSSDDATDAIGDQAVMEVSAGEYTVTTVRHEDSDEIVIVHEFVRN
jgi:hypothetical protein